jgi:protein TonB
MNTKYPYAKAAGISLILHTLLLGFLPLLGNIPTSVSNAAPAPIEVEFVPASVTDTGTTLADLSSPAVERPQQAERQAAPETDSPKQPAPSQQARSNEATAVQSSYTGAATLGIPNTVSGTTGSREAEKAGGQEQTAQYTQAGYISGARPAYPHDALKEGWEGTVVVRVLVDTDGSAAAVAVRRSSGYGALDDAAAQAVKKWRFAPAQRGDNPVESYFDVRVKFSLADAQAD